MNAIKWCSGNPDTRNHLKSDTNKFVSRKRNSGMKPFLSRLNKELQTIFSSHPQILSAYVFGSTALGIDREGSDMDIAIRLTEELSAERRFELRLNLMDDIENRLRRSVDIVILNDASLLLIHQVMKTGSLLYVMDEEDEIAFMHRKRKEYFDFKYYLDKDWDDLRAFFNH